MGRKNPIKKGVNEDFNWHFVQVNQHYNTVALSESVWSGLIISFAAFCKFEINTQIISDAAMESFKLGGLDGNIGCIRLKVKGLLDFFTSNMKN